MIIVIIIMITAILVMRLMIIMPAGSLPRCSEFMMPVCCFSFPYSSLIDMIDNVKNI